MCETKVVVVSISIVLLVAASFCIDQSHTENKVGHHSNIKSQGPVENEYRKYCLNDGECYYLVDEDIVGCNCTWLNEFKISHVGNFFYSNCQDEKILFQNLTRYFFSSQNLTRCIFFKFRN